MNTKNNLLELALLTNQVRLIFRFFFVKKKHLKFNLRSHVYNIAPSIFALLFASTMLTSNSSKKKNFFCCFFLSVKYTDEEE